MPKATKKTTTRKRTALKDLPPKMKDVTKKEGKRVKGSTKSGSEVKYYTITLTNAR